VEGEDFTGCITGGHPMNTRSLLEVIGTVSEALNTAWASTTETGSQLKLVHRDIKPANIRISRHGEVRLLDFGIAWSDDAGREAQTAHNSAVGSLIYMAPERFGREPVGSAADVYALGCTLFEGFADDALFAGAVALEMLSRAADADSHDAYVAHRLDALTDLHPGVRTLLDEMLRQDQFARPTAAEVAMRCEAVGDEVGGLSLKRWCRQRHWPAPAQLDSGWINRDFVDGGVTTERIPLGQNPPVASTYDDNESDTFLLGLDDVPAMTGSTDSDTQDFALLPTGQQPGVTAEVPPPSPTSWLAVAAPLVLAAVVLLAIGLQFSGGSSQELPVQANPITQPQAAPSEPARVEVEPPAPIPEPPAAPPPLQPIDAPAVEPVAAEPVVTKKVRRRTETAPTPAPAPVPEVKPEPVPEPVVAEVVFGTVKSSDASLKVELRGPNGTFSPGQVPSGKYKVFVDLGTGLQAVGSTEVFEGSIASVKCNAMTYTCEVK